MSTSQDLRRRVAALGVGVVGATALCLTYAAAVRTASGQAWDTRLMVWFGETVQASAWSDLPAEVLGLVSPASVLLGVVAVGLLGLVRGVRAAGAAVLTVVGAVLGAQVLKQVLVRPDLADLPSATVNSLPSGHTAAVAGVAAGLVVALGLHARPLAWVAAGLVTGAAGLATVALQWHRPSDVVASGLLAVGVAGVSLALVGRDRRRAPVPHVTAA